MNGDSYEAQSEQAALTPQQRRHAQRRSAPNLTPTDDKPVLEGFLVGIIDASLLRKAMQSCSAVDRSSAAYALSPEVSRARSRAPVEGSHAAPWPKVDEKWGRAQPGKALKHSSRWIVAERAVRSREVPAPSP